MTNFFSPMRFRRPGVLVGLVIFGVCFLWGAPAFAAMGDDYEIEAYDLLLHVDYRWAGTTVGGYYPIRIEVENQGPDCQLTFRFVPWRGQQLPEVERRNLQVASGSRARITLSIPMVGNGAFGRLEVERDGKVLEQLGRRLSLADADHHSHRTSVLIVSPVHVNVEDLEQAGRMESQPETRRFADIVVLEPPRLPNTWTDLSGLDLVMVPWDTLTELDADVRSAILQWTQTGGTLVIYDLGEPAPSAEEMHALLNLPATAKWTMAHPRSRGFYKRNFLSQNGSHPHGPGPIGPGGRWRHSHQDPDEENEWTATAETFAHCDYLLGRVYGFRDNPFPGTPYDWTWWASSMPVERTNWAARQGVLPRRANENFYNFLIPGVTSVPIYAFLVLMTLFTIVIGPLNYIFLRRRKKTYLLLLTIPAIAFLTSLTLFVYSTLAYGFDVTSRSRSLTVLDQRTNSAVSLSRISLFAGIAPSEGLKFSPDTAVYPMWAPLQFGQSQFESGRVVWGEQQELKDGWLRSRTRTQFATVQHRTERGRLEIEASSESTLRISNGLEWDIAGLLWVDDSGNVYHGGALGAGNTGQLELVKKEDFRTKLQPFQDVLEKNENLETPTDIEEENHHVIGIMERRIQQFLKIKTQRNRRLTRPEADAESTQEILPARTYLAVLAERPGIELGLEDTDERAGYHLLLGHY